MMDMQQQGCLTDQEIMDDILSSQKHITGMYDTYSCECVNQSLKSELLSIWKEEQQIQSDVFTEMQKRGWYAPKQAEQQQVEQTKTKFQNIASQLT